MLKLANLPDAPEVAPAQPSTVDKAKLCSALFALPASDADDYREWVATGMACKRAGDNFALWDAWSSRSAKYQGSESCLAKWEGFKADHDNPRNVATIFYRAKQYGWKWDTPSDSLGDAEQRYPTLTMRGLLSSDYTETYIVEDVLIKGMPMIMGGAPKTLKTAQLLDLAYNLSIGGAYLGKFRCTQSRVLMLTGESGGSAIKRRIETFLRAYGGEVAADDHFLISESLPRLRSEKDLALLSALMQTHGTDVVAIDPAYLCMGDGEAGNVQSQGVPLGAISEVCRKLHATIIIAHHVTKAAARRYGEPIELTDLTQAGFAEWARQWWLINRREEYEVGSGQHQFVVNAGNSSSYSALWAIDINEGTKDASCWEVEVTRADEVKAIDLARKLEDQIEVDAIAVKALLSCGPMAQSTLRGKANINFKRWNTHTFPTLLGRGLIKPTPGPKAGVTYYMLGDS